MGCMIHSWSDIPDLAHPVFGRAAKCKKCGKCVWSNTLLFPPQAQEE